MKITTITMNDFFLLFKEQPELVVLILVIIILVILFIIKYHPLQFHQKRGRRTDAHADAFTRSVEARQASARVA